MGRWFSDLADVFRLMKRYFIDELSVRFDEMAHRIRDNTGQEPDPEVERRLEEYRKTREDRENA